MTFKLQSKMSSIILVNDLFEELREENERLKQTIDLLVKYRICLIDFKDNCNCDKNLSNKLLVELLEKEWTQLKDNNRHQRSQESPAHKPSISRSQIVTQTDLIDSNHSNDGNHSTDDEITGGHRSIERIVVIDDSSSDEDSDVSPLVRNVIESDGEDVSEGMDEELISTADTSKTLRLTTVKTRRSTNRVINSVGNRNDRLKCGQSGCDRSFVYNIQLIVHMKRAHPELNPYSCSLCPNTYQQSEQLTDHCNTCHGVDQELVPTADTSNIIRSTNESTVGQLSAIDENRELNRCRLPDGRGFQCHYTDCRCVLATSNGFTNHMRRTHRGDYRFKCNKCHKRFVDSNGLRKHKKYSHNKCNTNAFECQYTDCQYKTHSKQNLKRHYLRHENKRSFKCPINGCKHRFNTTNALCEHKVKKHGFKRHKRIGL